MSDLAYDLARELGELKLIAVENRKRAEAAEVEAEMWEKTAANSEKKFWAEAKKLRVLQEAVEDTLTKTRNTKCIRLLEPALAKSKE